MIIKISGSWLNKWISVNGTQIKTPFEINYGDHKNTSVLTGKYILRSGVGRMPRSEKVVRAFHRKIISNIPQTDFQMSVDITEFI